MLTECTNLQILLAGARVRIPGVLARKGSAGQLSSGVPAQYNSGLAVPQHEEHSVNDFRR